MMKLTELVTYYDVPGGIILLEGKRNVLPEDADKLTQLGMLLAKATKQVIFRSGNASGADFYFTKGIAAIDPGRMQVITPYKGHRKSNNVAGYTVSLDDLNLLQEPDVIYHSRKNKSMAKLVDQYVGGERNKISIKAAYILRDTIKVLGTKNISPSTFAIFYDDLISPKAGGTGHTMQVCDDNNIPYINQQIWMDWL